MRAALLPLGCEQSNARMPLTYSRFAILILLNCVIFGNGVPTSTSNTPTAAAKAILDPKRRNDLVDEAFMEQKDILLDMLEAKLKEVRDKKKKRPDRTETSAVGEPIKCELLPDDVDLKLQASGIIAVGETDVQLKFGDSGNSTLNLNATGISNVGKTNLKLGVGNGTINIPGLQNLFLGSSFLRGPCEKRSAADPKMLVEVPLQPPKVDTNPNDDNAIVFRRNMVSSNTTNSTPASTSIDGPPAVVDSIQNNVTQSIPAPNVNVQNVTPVTEKVP